MRISVKQLRRIINEAVLNEMYDSEDIVTEVLQKLEEYVGVTLPDALYAAGRDREANRLTRKMQDLANSYEEFDPDRAQQILQFLSSVRTTSTLMTSDNPYSLAASLEPIDQFIDKIAEFASACESEVWEKAKSLEPGLERLVSKLGI